GGEGVVGVSDALAPTGDRRADPVGRVDLPAAHGGGDPLGATLEPAAHGGGLRGRLALVSTCDGGLAAGGVVELPAALPCVLRARRVSASRPDPRTRRRRGEGVAVATADRAVCGIGPHGVDRAAADGDVVRTDAHLLVEAVADDSPAVDHVVIATVEEVPVA